MTDRFVPTGLIAKPPRGEPPRAMRLSELGPLVGLGAPRVEFDSELSGFAELLDDHVAGRLLDHALDLADVRVITSALRPACTSRNLGRLRGCRRCARRG